MDIYQTSRQDVLLNYGSDPEATYEQDLLLFLVDALQLEASLLLALRLFLHGFDLLELLDDLLALQLDLTRDLLVVLLGHVHAIPFARCQQIAPQTLDLLRVFLRSILNQFVLHVQLHR